MDGGGIPLPGPADEPEPEPEPEKAPWSADDKTWDQRFAMDFELDLASLYAKPPHGQKLRIAQSSPWNARDPDSDDHDVAHTYAPPFPHPWHPPRSLPLPPLGVRGWLGAVLARLTLLRVCAVLAG